MTIDERRIFRFKSFLLDAEERQLRQGNAVVPLTPKSFDTLVYLVKKSGHLVTKDELMNAIWPDLFVDEANIPRTIHTLRKALGQDTNGNEFIETIPTKGYRFVAAIEQKANTDLLQSSVAVLPFENETGDRDFDYLSDGFSETLIDHLSKLSELKVIARSSSFRFGGRDLDLGEVSTKLGVRTIVIGKIAKSKEDLIIRAELVAGGENRQLWSESYTLATTEIQSTQIEVVKRISEILCPHLSGTQETERPRFATLNHEAYQQYLTGLFVAKTNPRTSLDHFIRATELDPEFALAFYRVSQLYFNLGYNTELNPRETAPKAHAALRRALELDDKLPGAYLLRAKIKQFEWDWKGAESDLARVISINPNSVEAHEVKADQLAEAGRIEEAANESRLRQILDPLAIWPKIQEGRIFYSARLYDKAVEQFRHVVKLAPDHSGARIWLGGAYSLKGAFQQAIAEYQFSAELIGDVTSVQCYLGYAFAKAGKRRDALAILRKLMTTKEYVSFAQLAILHIGLGDKTAAFESLERAYIEHDGCLQNLQLEPHYDDLRDDPQFVHLLERIGIK